MTASLTPVYRTAGHSGKGGRQVARGSGLKSVEPVWPLLLFVPIIVSGLVDMPRNVQFGTISALGLLSALYAIAAWGLWVLQPVSGPRVTLSTVPLLVFLGWAIALFIWFGAAQQAAAQNVGVLAAFVGVICLGYRVGRSGCAILGKLDTAFEIATWLAVGLYGAGLIVDVQQVLPSSRAFALVALLLMAWHLSNWRYGKRRGLWYALIITAFIGLSLSRVALALAVVLFPMSRMPARGVWGWVKLLLVAGLLVGLAQLALDNIEPLRQRFFEGDLSLQLGDIAINAEGRTTMWTLTLDSYSESPWIGKGPGSAEEMLTFLGTTFNHPHNDYLRILHDYGAIGLPFWLLGVVWIGRDCWTAWKSTDRARPKEAALHLAALLALSAAAAAMVTDNPIVYAHVMTPLGILLGLSLGAASRPQRVGPVR